MFFQSLVCQDPKNFLLEGLAKWKSDFLEAKWPIFWSSERLLEPASGTSFLPKISLKYFLPPKINRESTTHVWACFRTKKGTIRLVDCRVKNIFKLIFGKNEVPEAGSRSSSEDRKIGHIASKKSLFHFASPSNKIFLVS